MWGGGGGKGGGWGGVGGKGGEEVILYQSRLPNFSFSFLWALSTVFILVSNFRIGSEVSSGVCVAFCFFPVCDCILLDTAGSAQSEEVTYF